LRSRGFGSEVCADAGGEVAGEADRDAVEFDGGLGGAVVDAQRAAEEIRPAEPQAVLGVVLGLVGTGNEGPELGDGLREDGLAIALGIERGADFGDRRVVRGRQEPALDLAGDLVRGSACGDAGLLDLQARVGSDSPRAGRP
jgi:hypothetical protein